MISPKNEFKPKPYTQSLRGVWFWDWRARRSGANYVSRVTSRAAAMAVVDIITRVLIVVSGILAFSVGSFKAFENSEPTTMVVLVGEDNLPEL
nr:hypothetical protein [Tanacetum cinerariifolium]